MSCTPTAIVWFRRDLRVHDHPALAYALAHFDCVLPVFGSISIDEPAGAGRYSPLPRAA